ncbi:WYL domain-containing protein [Amycolatopsis minnesotensis]|uniref:WYL domain-containing protein n=2 Tax=Amycolatopsis minnesotensis TaxID=337894 RepID=A0ABN2S1G8_9PSEU
MDEGSTRKDMAGRLLRLLSLLESRREWSGQDLADRLGVTGRTLRRDIDRLRRLDYPVDSTTGSAGGYRLASGKNLPPLLLDDEEAIAVAVGLVTSANGSVAGIEDSSVRALTKLEQVLPARLRPRIAAVTSAAVIPHRDAPRVEPAMLAVVAGCCRDQEILSFGYLTRDGSRGERRVEPHHLVLVRGYWYLIAHDPARDDWRTFRVDRITDPVPTHRQFSPRELPAPDPATYLTRSLATAPYRYTAHLGVELPAEEVKAGVFAAVPGSIEPDGPGRCTVRISGESADLVVQYVAAIAALGAPFTVDAPEAVTERVRTLARRLGAA